MGRISTLFKRRREFLERDWSGRGGRGGRTWLIRWCLIHLSNQNWAQNNISWWIHWFITRSKRGHEKWWKNMQIMLAYGQRHVPRLIWGCRIHYTWPRSPNPSAVPRKSTRKKIHRKWKQWSRASFPWTKRPTNTYYTNQGCRQCLSPTWHWLAACEESNLK